MRKTLIVTFILLFHGIVHGANRCEQLGQSLAEITKQQAAMFPAKGGLSFEELNKEADRLKAEIIILETIKAAKDNLFETEDKQKKISKHRQSNKKKKVLLEIFPWKMQVILKTKKRELMRKIFQNLNWIALNK